MLPVFPLGHRDEVATAVEDDAPGGRGSLIDSDDKALGHYSPFVKPGWWVTDHQRVAPRSRETARAASRTYVTRAGRGLPDPSQVRSTGPESPIAPTTKPP